MSHDTSWPDSEKVESFYVAPRPPHPHLTPWSPPPPPPRSHPLIYFTHRWGQHDKGGIHEDEAGTWSVSVHCGDPTPLSLLLCLCLYREYLATFKKTVAMHEVFLQRLASHPTLRNDHHYQVFLEFDGDVRDSGKNSNTGIVIYVHSWVSALRTLERNLAPFSRDSPRALMRGLSWRVIRMWTHGLKERRSFWMSIILS